MRLIRVFVVMITEHHVVAMLPDVGKVSNKGRMNVQWTFWGKSAGEKSLWLIPYLNFPSPFLRLLGQSDPTNYGENVATLPIAIQSSWILLC